MSNVTFKKLYWLVLYNSSTCSQKSQFCLTVQFHSATVDIIDLNENSLLRGSHMGHVCGLRRTISTHAYIASCYTGTNSIYERLVQETDAWSSSLHHVIWSYTGQRSMSGSHDVPEAQPSIIITHHMTKVVIVCTNPSAKALIMDKHMLRWVANLLLLI
jgi:hypothetical protein